MQTLCLGTCDKVYSADALLRLAQQRLMLSDDIIRRKIVERVGAKFFVKMGMNEFCICDSFFVCHIQSVPVYHGGRRRPR